jgi:asparagine synthase (glutamine-hydrolysing)
MCGIAGGMFWGRAASKWGAARVVRAMTSALGHRGPDDEGMWVSDGLPAGGPVLAFGHRRLTIIDPSVQASQPMATSGGVITYNGEAYNFAALRQQLEAEGEVFRSRSDTEVVLRGYLHWGPRLLARLRGMYAFAVWDARRGSLSLVRDRFGMKPLYYFEGAGCLLFASEIRALLASGLVPRRLDRTAMWEYLGYQAVPAPRTIVDGVRMVLPGHTIEVRHDRPIASRQYWDLLSARRVSQDSDERSRIAVGRLLDDSITAHLVSDVPIALFLSGGLDSSAIALLMAARGRRPTTFSVVMPDTRLDERAAARTIATATDADHREIDVTEAEVRQLVPDAVARMDHPSADGINTFIIAAAVRGAGFKAALSGVGGDEIFGGYPSFRRFAGRSGWLRRWGRAPRQVRRAASRAVGALDGLSRVATKASAVLDSDGSMAHVWPITRQLFTTSERGLLLNAAGRGGAASDPYVEWLEAAYERHADADVMARVSYAEARTYLPDVLLADADQMGMAHGVEIRAPFVDHMLAEYVVGLPEARKQRPSGRGKSLLIDALGDLLPREFAERPKRGFTLPMARWMHGPLRATCDAAIAAVDARAGLNPDAVRALWRDFLTGRRDHRWQRVWAVVVLQTWIARHGLEGLEAPT